MRSLDNPRPDSTRGRWVVWVLAIALLVSLGLIAFIGRDLLSGFFRAPQMAVAARDAGEELTDGLDASSEAPGPALAALRGTVLDPLGKPAKGALVWASDELGRLRQARTPEDGSFVLIGLPPGRYRVAAQREAQTSETEGPLPLGEGDDLRGLTLTLANGGRIAGAVLDRRTRAPLPGAIVQITATPLSAITDARGHFLLPPLPSGGHELDVEAESHLSRRVPLAVQSGDDLRDLEIFLTPSARVTGTVVDAAGNPVPRAMLFLSRYQAELGGPPPAAAGTADAVGHFALNLAPGLVQVVARAPRFAEGMSDMLDLQEGKPQEVKIPLAAGAQVDGTVTLAGGQPATSGAATAFRPGRWQVGEGRIGPDGRFTLSGLPAGKLTISADAAQARATAEVELEPGAEVPVALHLGDHSIEGVVVGNSGGPVAGALVVARPVGAGEAGERSALSAADGSFKVTGLSGEHFDLAATKDEGNAALRGVAAGRHDVRLSLASGGVAGTVLAPGGLAVSDFYVAAEPEVPGQGRARGTQVVDGRGAFHLGLAPGRYRIRATAPGYSEGKIDDIEVAAAAETRGVRLELQPAGTIEGQVLDEKGAPLAGVHLATDRGHAWGVGRGSPLGGSAAQSDATGHFVLHDVGAGRWPVIATAPHLQMVNGPPVVEVVGGHNPSPVEIRMQQSDNDGNQLYAGIGMSLFPSGDRKFAGEVFEGGPAQDAAIRGGDEILAIDGQSSEGLSIQDLASRIRGPEGTEVTLQMRRGTEGEAYTVVVPRGEIRY